MNKRSPTRLRVLNTPVDWVDMAGALAFVDDYVRFGEKPGTILAVNPEKVYVLRENESLRKLYDSATLLVADGIGIVKALRFLYSVKITRVTGADLMLKICAAAPEKGYRLFIYGAKEEVNRGSVEILEKRHPGIRIVGRANGYVKPEEMDDLIKRINQSQADILFVALGSPRQELWIYENLPKLNVKLCQGIGGTLDTITGAVKRAPACFQAVGLEWFYRLLKQPTRFKRQINLARFAMEVIAYRFKK
jgi:N-acetylglucosaminyldiphosphoundecaprenol N-acetyl-beta-D-mannosaminyltransferase